MDLRGKTSIFTTVFSILLSILLFAGVMKVLEPQAVHDKIVNSVETNIGPLIDETFRNINNS